MNMDVAHLLPQQKYDVFLSFRGADTRLKFTSHLYAALKRRNILTYMDDKSLERGDAIAPALLTAIEQSKLSIIVFSEQYASSTWCLDELVNIMRCEEAYGQVVVPVFYDIDPSDVRWQQRSYADAFVDFEERFKENMKKVQTWRDALTRATNLSGFHSQSQNIRNESEFIETIVEVILLKLNQKSSSSTEGLVGMKNNIRRIESLLCSHAQDVSFRTIGIWGMGGCGKTTLADVVFHRNSSDFEACAFVSNIRERSEKDRYHLRNEFLRKLLNEEHLIIDSPSIGSSFIRDRISRTKVLVVFDDVTDLSQLEFLLDKVQFGSGSRVIITTRNKRLLKKRVHEDHIYQVNLLSSKKALQLFQSIAFEDDCSREDYSNLSLKVVGYAGCNPLALKVLASSFLLCKSKRVWEQELKKLERFPNNEVQNVLRLCYDRLEENEKGIFLDIACFLKGKSRCVAERLLEMHGFSPLSGLEVLIDMSLISIKGDRVEMHDLLQEMGKAIESGIEELGKRKRIWNAKDSYQVFNNKSGTSVVEALYLDMSKIRELQLSPTIFRDMQNLKLLKFYAPPEVHAECKRQRRSIVEVEQSSWLPHLPVVKAFQCLLAKSRIWGPLRSMLDSYKKVSDYDYEVFQKYCKLYFPRGLESLPEELRYLYWEGYPFKSLPSKYFPENLVEIRMPRSKVKRLWNNNQNLCSLKHLTLSYSKQLIEVPDLTGSPNMESINLLGCTSLVEVPSYFQNLSNLTYLNLDYCYNLKILGGIPCNIEVLCMYGSKVEQIPSSIWSCEKLHTLGLGLCLYLENLSTSKLDLYDVDQKLLPQSCEVQRWPSSSTSSVVGHLISLRKLDLGSCGVTNIPDCLISLSTLEDLNLSGTMIENIPTSILNISGLHTLCLIRCKKLRSLPELPYLLQYLFAIDCTSLVSIASSRVPLLQPRQQYEGSTRIARWESFSFTGCWKLDESSKKNILDDAQLRIIRMASSKKGTSLTICPGSEIPKWIGNQREGCETNMKFPHHELDTTTEKEYPLCLDFAISVVLAPRVVFPGNAYHDIRYFNLVCDFNFKTNNDSEGYRHKFRSGPLWVNFKEDHVVTFFVKCEDVKLKNKKKKLGSDLIPYSNPVNNVTEASVRFYPINPFTTVIEVKRCGLKWLYDDTIRLTRP